MKRLGTAGLRILVLALLWGLPGLCIGATMTDYCQTPPFIGSGGSPNILIVNDVSGSMSWPAYSKLDNGTTIPYDATVGYEGYFDPSQYYTLVGSTYVATAPSGTSVCIATCDRHSCVRNERSCAMGSDYGGGIGAFGCSTRGSKTFGCCTHLSTSGCGADLTGNYLNWQHMARIDLLRWALTGGRPASCTGSATFNANQCDPELWSQSGNASKVGAVCNNSIQVNTDGTTGGCILEMDDGTQVAVPWSRVYDGLATQFMNLPLQPRLGVMSFDTSGVNSQKVYPGDFLSSNVNSATFPYENFITNINSQDAGGGTPTGPAMWDALNYFAQNAPEFGGFPNQSGSGDRWKNPLFICDGGGGNNCVQNTCARNYVLLMSDGEWNTPYTKIGTSLTGASLGSSPTCTTTKSSQSSDPVVPAYCMHKGFTNTGTNSTTNVSGVYTIGLFMQAGSAGMQAMENIALYGSFQNDVKTWPDSLTGFPPNSPTCTDTDGTCSGSLCAAMPTSSPDWDGNGDGVPDTFYTASDASNIKQDIMNAIQDILSHATSGTAASVLASSAGSAANIVQATYYPRRKFFDTAIQWTGGLQNLWYWIDPSFVNSGIREDNDDDILNLLADDATANEDFIASFYFDTGEQKAKAHLYTSLSGGVTGTQFATVDFENLKNLWEAGVLLWNRDPDDRDIFTPLDSTSDLTASTNSFDDSNVGALEPLLNTDDPLATAATNSQLAENIIDYTRGTDLSPYTYTDLSSTVTISYRSRTVKVDVNGDGVLTNNVPISGGTVTVDETQPNVWKLGDIIDSTPILMSGSPLNSYDTKWDDSTYSLFYSTPSYTSRGMVFVGANDGMLHAFKMGTLQFSWPGQQKPNEVAKVTGTDQGKEMWAFIPKDVLPYLQYVADPNYCHLQLVDLTSYLVDASIMRPSSCTAANYWDCQRDVTSWRTVLVGGMRLGGACADPASTCTDCVKSPVSGNGYSAYFALDVTDQNNPKLLWEFWDPDLGFSTSGPAIVRISSRTPGTTTSALDTHTNGRWFVVVGSGPTGPIDTTTQKFQGRSDQNLKLFVIDLRDGTLVRKIDTGIPNAFSGSLFNAAFDNFPYSGGDYQDRAVYIPYTKLCTSTTANCTAGTWTDGGVLRLLTNQDLNGNNVSATGDTALNPDNWVLSTVMSGIGPVTGAVTNLLNMGAVSGPPDGPPEPANKLWLFFATGRYYYRTPTGGDDPTTRRRLYGIVDPCYLTSGGYAADCLNTATTGSYIVNAGDLSSANTSSASGAFNPNGWYYDLEPSGTYTYDENNNGTTADDVARSYDAERVITDPTADAGSGTVFFVSLKPYNDLCAIGGKTFIYALDFDTGGAQPNLSGTMLIQVSTGAIEQMNMSTAFTGDSGRRTGALEGLPPVSQGLNLMSAPGAAQTVFHRRER